MKEKQIKLKYGFDTPLGYDWLLEHNLVGYEPFSALQPWHYLAIENTFNVTNEWSQGPYQKGDLIAFARRQDCDDIACFGVRVGKVESIVVIHGWTAQGYDVIGEYDSFWDWLKSVINDIADWATF